MTTNEQLRSALADTLDILNRIVGELNNLGSPHAQALRDQIHSVRVVVNSAAPTPTTPTTRSSRGDVAPPPQQPRASHERLERLFGQYMRPALTAQDVSQLRQQIMGHWPTRPEVDSSQVILVNRSEVRAAQQRRAQHESSAQAHLNVRFWFTQVGWTTAHHMRSGSATWTLCGRELGRSEDRSQATEADRRCGQCLRRCAACRVALD